MDGQNNPGNNYGERDGSQQQNFQAPNNSVILSVFAYLGPLSIFSYLLGKDDFSKFHARQGVVLFGIEVVIWLLGSWMYSVYMLLQVLNLATLILSIIGIVNVIHKSKRELPLIGNLYKSFGL